MISELNQDNNQKQENRKLKDQVSELNQENRKLKDQVSELNRGDDGQITKLKRENSKLKEQISELNQENRKQNQKDNDQIGKLKRENRKQKEQISVLNTENKEQKELISELNRNNVYLKRKLERRKTPPLDLFQKGDRIRLKKSVAKPCQGGKMHRGEIVTVIKKQKIKGRDLLKVKLSSGKIQYLCPDEVEKIQK